MTKDKMIYRPVSKKYQREATQLTVEGVEQNSRIATQTQGGPIQIKNRSTTTPNKIERPAKNSKYEASQKWCNEVLSSGLRNLRKSFIDFVKPYSPADSRTAFNNEKNFDKNRYDDVELIDGTRVKVKLNLRDDYIHASFVKLNPSVTLICTQGPLDSTIQQFWTMIIEQSAKVILQLCQCIEDGKEKSAAYMPQNSVGKVREFGQIKVKIIGTNLNVGSMKKVTRTLVEICYPGKVHEATHLLYSGWPDHSVPESMSTYFELRNLVFRIYGKSPIVAHCSAGVGRTGSFAAIEMAIYQLTVKHDMKFSMIETVHQLRNQRAHSVQNDQQYAFIHRVVIDYLIARGLIEKTIQLRRFFKEYDDLILRKRLELDKHKSTSNKKK